MLFYMIHKNVAYVLEDSASDYAPVVERLSIF